MKKLIIFVMMIPFVSGMTFAAVSRNSLNVQKVPSSVFNSEKIKNVSTTNKVVDTSPIKEDESDVSIGPVVGGGGSGSGDELCDLTNHDVTKIHSHYDEEDQCWYDHSHIAPEDPGPSALFQSITGQELSYPWLTGTGGSENIMWPGGKHEAYNFHSGQVFGPRVDPQSNEWNCINDESCNMKFEVEWHGMSTNMGMRTRFHSFYAVIRPDNGLTDSYIAWGGWMDCGQQVSIDGVNYVVDENRPQPNGTALKHTQISNNGQTWYCQLPDLPIENVMGQQYGKQIGATTPENLFSPLEAYCGPGTGDTCMSRGQNQEVALLLFDISSPWTNFVDPDGNGWVEHYEAYTDRYGNIQPAGTCTQADLDCVPLIIHNVERLRYLAQSNDFGRMTTTKPEFLDWWNR